MPFSKTFKLAADWVNDLIKAKEKIENLEAENDALRGLLTQTWRLIGDAKLDFGDDGPRYYDGWNRYHELDGKCGPYLKPFYEDTKVPFPEQEDQGDEIPF